MKYKHKLNKQDDFGKLLQQRNIYEADDNGQDAIAIDPYKTATSLIRDSQEPQLITINTIEGAALLLDYLSTDKRAWDYEPRITIEIDNKVIEFQARGNYGHLSNTRLMKEGDTLIVEKHVIEKMQAKAAKPIKPAPVINNRIYHESIESDVVYPDLHSDKKLFAMQCILDKDFVKRHLHMRFGVDYINNKYVIEIDIYGVKQYWYQHDSNTWLLNVKNN